MRETVERPTGIEPVSSAWEAEVIPLYDGRLMQDVNTEAADKVDIFHKSCPECRPLLNDRGAEILGIFMRPP